MYGHRTFATNYLFSICSEEEEDELMPSFNIYMQILISQALEPGFLAAINEEKGTSQYHFFKQSVDVLLFSIQGWKFSDFSLISDYHKKSLYYCRPFH